MTDPSVWVVRASHEAEQVVGPLSVMTIGWPEMVDLGELATRELMKHFFQSSYPDRSEPRVWAGAGQFFRFAHDIDIGTTCSRRFGPRARCSSARMPSTRAA